MNILFEDNHLILVNKKPGEIVQGDKTGDEPLSEKIKKYIRVKYSKPGEVFLGTVHRIDRPVSGIVLFARTSKALERLNKMFREKEITKRYWACVKNAPPGTEGHLTGWLKKNEKQNKSYVSEVEKPGSLFSELTYKVLGKGDMYYLLEINPITGRHHQIRAMLAHMGCPIKGDLKYGAARSNADGSIHLHARSISFLHPVKKDPVFIVAEPPADKLWQRFTDMDLINEKLR
jgi:23S rRNA pseudouridine1911/1915/1917 synthase